MTAEFGLYALILALILALAQTGGALIQHSAGRMAMRSNALMQLFCTTLALGALMLARLDADFSVRNVAEHSHRALPWIYKFTGTWGNHEGSLLLWVWVLAGAGALFALRSSQTDTRLTSTTLAIQGLLLALSATFVLFTSNPFERIFPPPPDGSDLNPLLQDIGLAIHPPLLYLGYVGFSLVFSLAVAGLLEEKRIGRAWAELAHPWILGAWSALTLGIGLGAWWAYRELGWGGWWFWDPVENASLLPWLSGTALLHANIVLRKREALAGWVVLLSILTFSFSLLSTFLVRSGALISVHSFASDPERGLWILGGIALITGSALMIYALRTPPPSLLQPVSREGMLLLNNLLLMTACLTVLTALLYPLFLEAWNGQRISIGAPYFYRTVIPLAAIALLLTAPALATPWHGGRFSAVVKNLRPALWAATGTAGIFSIWWEREMLLSLIGFFLALWVGGSALLDIAARTGLARSPLSESFAKARRLPASAYRMLLAHGGAAMLIIGATGSHLWQQQHEQAMMPGDRFHLGEYTLIYQGSSQIPKENYMAMRGLLEVTRDGRTVSTLTPETRVYSASGANTTEAAIHSNLGHDLYAVLGKTSNGTEAAIRVYRTPLIAFVWIGCIMMACGAMIGVVTKKDCRAS